MSRPRKYKGNAKQRKLAANRAWQRANPDKARAATRAWQRANPDKVRAAKRAWQRANPDKARAATRAYRKRILRLAKLAIAAGLQ